MLYKNLNPEKALIWRITHRQNIPWILEYGLHAAQSPSRSPQWITIGNSDLIKRRGEKRVPLSPHGVLNDYIPLYFTPFSPMMYNIYTGRGGVEHIPNADVIILVSSLHKVSNLGLPFVFTDKHAYVSTANYYNDLERLHDIDWGLLQQRNFKRDPDDPAALERYQAEALIYEHMPIEGLIGAICYSEELQMQLQNIADASKKALRFECRPNWYF